MPLHHELVAPRGATAQQSVLFLHGILGSGGNLRTLARRFVEARPTWQAVLVDLRAHGKSQDLPPPDTLAAATDDVAELARTLAVPAHAVVGHSFGGKVALGLSSRLPALTHVVTLDASPGPRVDARGSETTVQVLQLLEGLEGPWPTREAFVQQVEAAGLPRSTAQWLAMNLAPAAGGFALRLDLARIRALLSSFLEADLWPLLSQTPGPHFHLVIAALASVYAPDDRARATTLAAERPGRVTVDFVEAGHWLHVEQPDRVLDVLLARIPG